ncbi:MAG: hemolysin family protein [Bacteroidia bacterium]
MIFFFLAITFFSIGFYAATETAWLSALPLQLESWYSSHPRSYRWYRYFAQKPTHLITLLLVGNAVGVALFSELFAWVFPAPELSPLGQILWYTGWSALIILIGAEFLPKAIAYTLQDKFLLHVLPVLWLWYWILLPVVYPLGEILRWWQKDNAAQLLNKPLLREDFRQSVAQDTQIESQILQNALRLSDVPIEKFMIPRTEIFTLPYTSTPEEIHNAFVETQYTRLFIYKDTPENLVGYIHLQQFLSQKDTSMEKLLRQPLFVPENLKATALLETFIQNQSSVALVVDALGSVVGLVTSEDLVEEVFGEIDDEYDETLWIEKQLSPTTYELSARLEVHYLNSRYGWNLPLGNYTTLGGLLVEKAQRIPEIGEKITLEPYSFTVLERDDKSLKTVKLEILTDS